MKLNADVGEGFGPWSVGDDAALMPYLDMANIACGFHASDPDGMDRTVCLALDHGVMVGAHPGYRDLEGFGRRSIPHEAESITRLVAYQVGALQAICDLHGAQVEYVKPHGALYHDMMRCEATFEAVLTAVAAMPGHPALMILAGAQNEKRKQMAECHQVPLLMEAFADRAYSDGGSLLPRGQPGAVYASTQQMVDQVMQIKTSGTVTSVNGREFPLSADTVCVHGDNAESIAAVARIRKALQTG
ncbi:5-oxoprolinase subunit PxpA [Verrucomicrobiaceae bacterium N1E253]|uniref:5-oxoprolinase subunit PxpA n=1 Tax=Oceaniferula marina TaxID=2748318 RepID=A0A851GH90_9BACT|nr:5-oxoprolinase subunit PxpA [Oceaniferula marina]NWK55221.1 5-oxoprolinase subunit PxpA [Oceaniferula marina]